MRFRSSGPGRLLSGIRSRPLTRRAWAALAGVAVVLTVAGLVAGLAPGSPAGAARNLGFTVRPRAAMAKTPDTRAGQPARADGEGAPGGRTPRSGGPGVTPRANAASRASAATSCRSVAHVGDSTSVDLISPADLPDPADRLRARYADVGVKHLLIDASGGRSIVEVLPGQVNGYNVAQAWWNQGYRGCWVFALGTNDTANVSVGSAVGLMSRIDEMMAVAHGEPVLWVNTVTELATGPWSEANEQLWDNTLVSALGRYPNMRILDWAALAQPGWFLSDEIHYDEAGCEARAQAIAQGLANAFPADGHSRGQIVR